MKYALVNKETNKIENIIIWDGITAVEWPNGCTAVLANQEHEAEFSAKYASVPSEQGQLTEQELELLRNLLARA